MSVHDLLLGLEDATRFLTPLERKTMVPLHPKEALLVSTQETANVRRALEAVKQCKRLVGKFERQIADDLRAQHPLMP